MEVSVTDDTVFNEILSAEDLEQIPESVCKKLKHACTEKFNELIAVKGLLETHRNNFDEKYSALENKLEGINQEYEESKKKLDLVENFKAELQNKYDEARKKISNLENTVIRLEKDDVELRRQRDLFFDERDTFQSQVERRNTELELVRAEVASLNDQLQVAITTKCNALQDIEKVKSREMTLDFKEKRLEQKEKLMNQEIASLKEQIANLTSELQTIRSDALSRSLKKDTRLAQLEEELRISNESIGVYRDAQATLQQRCDRLAQKVEEQRNQEIAMNHSYREEVVAQMKVADSYKDLAAEANKKEEDFKEAIKELQNLLRKAAYEYGILETKYCNETENLRKDIEERDAKIKELTDKLNNANELLHNFKQEKMEQAIVQLAPSAVVTNRILKKGLSLTEMYNQLVECTNESTMVKAENEHLKNEMNKINDAMEENLPFLQQKLQNYATAMDNIKTLKTQMDELVLEKISLQEIAKEARRKADFHVNQTAKSKSEINYLARQVCVLLQEIQKLQTGYLAQENECSMTLDSDELMSSQAISKHLVTFKDIEELQKKNQQLLSVVRTLAANKEEVENLAEEFNTGALKERIQGYTDKIEQMHIDRERMEEMLEQIREEYGTYRRMVESQDVNETDEDEGSDACENNFDDDNKKSKRIKNLKKKFAESEAKVKQLNKELEMNKQEKEMQIKMLNDNMKKLQKEVETSSTKCCNLKVRLDTANEQFHLLQANVASYKAQIKALEEKCCNYNTTIDKHEHSLTVLENDLMNAKLHASQTRVQFENLKHDHQLLQASEVRLIQKIDVLQRERQDQALLKTNVESIKASLERAQSEKVIRIEQRIDNANRECAALRRRLQEEQDRFREITIKLEKQTNEAQERLLEEKQIANKAKAELEAMKKLEMQHLKCIDELSMKMKETETNFMMKPSSSRIKELELELANHQAEIKTLSNQLKSTQHQSGQYFSIAEGSKLMVRELTAQCDKVKEEHEQALLQSQEQIITLQKKVEDLEAEVTKARSEHQESCPELRERLSQSEKKLEELDELKGQIEILKSELKTSVDALTEAEDRYAKEMILHSGDIQIKEDSSVVSRQIEALTQERDSAVAALEIEKSTTHDCEAHYQKEIEETKQRLESLNKQNSLLKKEIKDATHKFLKNEEKSKQILRTARHKIETMHEIKINHEKEIAGLKEKIESESLTLADTQTKLITLESQIAKLVKENAEILAENKALSQKIESAHLKISPQYRTPAIYRTTTETSSTSSFQAESTSESESTQCEMESSETEQQQPCLPESKQVQQQIVASSSSRSVSTSPTSLNQKRQRNEETDEISQEQTTSPKTKRIRHYEVSDGGFEVEYQIATSSQRDKDEEEHRCFEIESNETIRGNVQKKELGSHAEMEEGRTIRCVEVEIKSNDNEVELVELVDDSASSTVGSAAVNDTKQINVSSINVAVEAQETSIIDLSSKKSPNTEGVSTYRKNDPKEYSDDTSITTETASEGEASPSHNTRRRTQSATSFAASFSQQGMTTRNLARTLIKRDRRGRLLSSRGGVSIQETRGNPSVGSRKRGIRDRTRNQPSRLRSSK